MAPQALGRSSREPTTDLRVEAVAFPSLHRNVTGKGVEEIDVLLSAIARLPIEVANFDHLEEPCVVDFGSLPLELARPRPGIPRGGSLSDILVDLLDLNEEGVTVDWEHVGGSPKAEVASWAQRLPCLVVAHFWIDPMPSRCSEYEIEPPSSWKGPFLKVTSNDLNPGKFGEILASCRGESTT